MKTQNTINLNKTLYISPLMVMNDKEYTKHYFIEGERVATKIGGGFRYAPTDPDAVQLQFMGTSTATSVSDDLWTMTIRGVDCSGYPSARVSVKPKLRPARNDASRAESQQYFYHPDHLGSSSFVTDAAGLVEQHMQYLPFGELFVNQQNSTYDTRYKVSAKLKRSGNPATAGEKDNETNYSYFGARYYDSDLSVWLSVDPLSDMYPSMSPYMYTAGNPVRLVDPNGMSIDDALDGGPGKKASQQPKNSDRYISINSSQRVTMGSTKVVSEKKVGGTGYEPKKNRQSYDNDPGGGGNGNTGSKPQQIKVDLPAPASNPSETNVNLDGNLPPEVSTIDFDSKNNLPLENLTPTNKNYDPAEQSTTNNNLNEVPDTSVIVRKFGQDRWEKRNNISPDSLEKLKKDYQVQ
ncbi:MAG: RHS repeat-associated core domain-containing protein [Bacteroidales bacterium]|nr:RHS repeat-associated core domain-containing protein [Bacteroidales bacterium]